MLISILMAVVIISTLLAVIFEIFLMSEREDYKNELRDNEVSY